MNAQQQTTAARSTSFERRMTAVGLWHQEHGRNPRAGSPARDEAPLGAFLAGCRAAAKGKGTTSWSPERQAFADRVAPRWQFHSDAHRDDANFRELMTA